MKLLRFFTNKYLIAAAAFGVWITFFDQNDWVSQRERKKELKDTKENIVYLNQEIAGMEKEYEALMSSPAALEKFARERYRMKKDNEDIYVIEK